MKDIEKYVILVDRYNGKEYYFCPKCKEKLRDFIVKEWDEKNKKRVLTFY